MINLAHNSIGFLEEMYKLNGLCKDRIEVPFIPNLEGYTPFHKILEKGVNYETANFFL